MTDRELIFERDQYPLQRVSYRQLQRVKISTDGQEMLVDYHNDAGGLMGMVLQLPKDAGECCGQWLARFGILVEESPVRLRVP